jgi:hypothetical protein
LASLERHHAAAAPEIEPSHELFEGGAIELRRTGVLRATAGFPGLDKQTDVIGATESVCRQVRFRPWQDARSPRAIGNARR